MIQETTVNLASVQIEAKQPKMVLSPADEEWIAARMRAHFDAEFAKVFPAPVPSQSTLYVDASGAIRSGQRPEPHCRCAVLHMPPCKYAFITT